MISPNNLGGADMKLFRLSVFSLLAFCLALTVLGQETTGGIEGTVKDPTGAVVPNVSITIVANARSVSGTTTTGTGSGFHRTVNVDENGFFRVLQVPPGNYDISTASVSGFGASRYENVS